MKRFVPWAVPWAVVLSAPFVGPKLPDAWAEGTCRTVEVRFTPQGLKKVSGREPLSPQIAVWVEDKSGKFIDTLFVTRATGILGIGNRPGRAEMKGDFRWPYGRRPMVLPIWAHARGRTYPHIVMGGRCSPNCGGDAHNGAANPDDEDTVAYHANVSSNESYFCSPSGWRTQVQNGVDVISCASAFFGSKGRFLPGATSVYPPRADIDPSQVSPLTDHEDLKRFSTLNDVAAVSGATPPLDRALDPPVRWPVPQSLSDGEYVVKVEVSIEADFNGSFPPGLSLPDKYPTWDVGYGKQFIGQPSILYAVPFVLANKTSTAQSLDYVGYGDVMGKTGAVSPPDDRITKGVPGSGAERLQAVMSGEGAYRVQVGVVPCGVCTAPPALPVPEVSDKTDSTMTLRLRVPDGAPQGTAIQVRYRELLPISEETFNQALPAPAPKTGKPGEVVSTLVQGLLPKTNYHVAVRAVAPCGAASPITVSSSNTEVGQFTTLSGCFVATAAYGTELAPEVSALRKVRDRYLLKSPLGQTLVATYYAFSPPLAGVIAGNEGLRQASRRALRPLIQVAQSLR